MRSLVFTITCLFVASCGGGQSGTQNPPPRQVPVAGPTTKGLSNTEIRTVVRSHLNEITFCYEKYIDAQDKEGQQSQNVWQGQIIAKFTIDPKGEVTEGFLERGSDNIVLNACIANAIGSWQFPQSANRMSTTVRYPFTLAKRDL